jgi:hypothetical protein
MDPALFAGIDQQAIPIFNVLSRNRGRFFSLGSSFQVKDCHREVGSRRLISLGGAAG